MKIEEKAIYEVVGKGIPKPAGDQNTDDIVPARFLKEITFANMGEYAFYDERFKDGVEVKEHPLNKYKGGSILVAGPNFGCGSSREHAPQALLRYGVKAIVAPSFAEIFAGNCHSVGIVAATVTPEEISDLVKAVEENPSADIQLSVFDSQIEYKNAGFITNIDCNIPQERKQALLDGTWDAMTVLQQDQEGIAKTEKNLEYLTFR